MVPSSEGQVMPTQSRVKMRVSQMQNRGRILSQEELARVNQDIMATEKLVRDFLVGEGYMPADVQNDKVSLTHILLLLAHCTPASMLHKGIWAVTMLLEHEGLSKAVEILAVAVTRRVDPLTDLMEHSTKVVQDAAMDTRKAVMVIYSMWEEVRDKMQKVVDTTKEEWRGQWR